MRGVIIQHLPRQNEKIKTKIKKLSLNRWWSHKDSNWEPHKCNSEALPHNISLAQFHFPIQNFSNDAHRQAMVSVLHAPKTTTRTPFTL